MVRRPSEETARLLAKYLPVRVLDMRGVDLLQWRFDFDLTLAAVIAAPDGTILHRYGGRDSRGADRWLDEGSFHQFLRAGLASYAVHSAEGPAEDPAEDRLEDKANNTGRAREGEGAQRSPLPLEAVPAFAERDRGECIHCHSVNPAMRLEAQRRGDWSLDDLWTYPPPSHVGLDLDVTDQRLVTAVRPGSAAELAGIKVGDRLVSVAGRSIATATDLMAMLDEAPPGPHSFPFVVEGPSEDPSGKLRELVLDVENGWKAYTPAEFAWRPSKWGLAPAPGFGGPVLGPKELRAIGLDEGTFAFKVSYLVTWGENKRFGVAAAQAGIREGMIVLGVKGKRDFESLDHFHAWWRLTVPLNSTVEVAIHGRSVVQVVVGAR